MPPSTQLCPICHSEVQPRPRYPTYICKSCREKMTDFKGERVYFYNTEMMGSGCQGYYSREGELQEFSGNECFVGGIKCIADEAYFGGIVICSDGNQIKERYFEIGSEGGGSVIYRITKEFGESHFYKLHSTYDVDADDVITSEKYFLTFDDYLQELFQMDFWFLLHPVSVHNDLKPVLRKVIRELPANNSFDPEIIEIHKNIWNRVLNDELKSE